MFRRPGRNIQFLPALILLVVLASPLSADRLAVLELRDPDLCRRLRYPAQAQRSASAPVTVYGRRADHTLGYRRGRRRQHLGRQLRRLAADPALRGETCDLSAGIWHWRSNFPEHGLHQ
jgi:hypothetical protein